MRGLWSPAVDQEISLVPQVLAAERLEGLFLVFQALRAGRSAVTPPQVSQVRRQVRLRWRTGRWLERSNRLRGRARAGAAQLDGCSRPGVAGGSGGLRDGPVHPEAVMRPRACPDLSFRDGRVPIGPGSRGRALRGDLDR